jgi:hypothetical protein
MGGDAGYDLGPRLDFELHGAAILAYMTAFWGFDFGRVIPDLSYLSYSISGYVTVYASQMLF